MTKRKEDDDLLLNRSIGRHAVFISHYGIEMKRQFASHLYYSLMNRGIRVILDLEDLPDGNGVHPSMLEVARRAFIHVPLITNIYAGSTGCLDELVEMMKSTKSPKNAKVLPVFYDVNVEDLRNKDGPFGEAIKAHRKEGKHNEDTIQGWEDALNAASWLEGFRLETYHRREGELLTALVKKIEQEIEDRIIAEVDPNAVGLEERVRDVVELLHLEERNVFFLLLWGMGGIGKTTLARAIFNRIRQEFPATSFVENCGDEKPNRIQQSLLNDLLLQKNFKGDVRTGRECLKHGLSGKKVLIILDDVKDFESIEKVIDLTSLHPGSLILVTSRSQNVFPLETTLSNVFKGERYKVQGIFGDEALLLLCLHAFKKPSPEAGFEVLAERVSQACGGLPLSLEVLGCHLRKKKKKELWEDAIVKLRSNQCRGIEGALMISYKDLNVEEQEMFLDVACFLKGEDKRSAEYFWDGLVKAWSTGLESLMDLCLVKVGKNKDKECLTMHDQLRDLGRAIVEKEYKKSGKWSRVWDSTDLLRVLQSKQGLDQIRGLATSLPILSVGLLVQMRSLQLLFLDNTKLDGNDEGLEGLKIRWLKLTYDDGAPKELLGMKFLTVLTLRGNDDYGKQMELSFSYGRLKKLQKLDMYGCNRLEQLPEDFGSLESLEELDVRDSAITKLPSSFGQLKKLRKLDMYGCNWLEQLPEDFRSLESLEELDVRDTAITKLPSSFGQLKKLRELRMP